MEWSKGQYTVSTDKRKLSVDTIYDFLTQKSYWAKGRTREQVVKSIEHSLCFGVYHEDRQIGFARVLSDFAVLYWIFDVFIIEEYRGKGLGKWLVECIVNHPKLVHLNGFLATKDAQELYRKFGFVESTSPQYTQMKRAPK